jgi:[acyl-carrier-protein] S-malonyltransferase
MSIAFIFPGQGSNARAWSELAGIGRARRVFAEANEALGFTLSKLCFEGPDEELQLTANTRLRFWRHRSRPFVPLKD